MNIIDLFAGCGGFSLGFEMAGFSIPIAVEMDDWASETYRYNHSNTNLITSDIREIADLDKLYVGEVDGIIGGPPCQGFSLSGHRDTRDPRNSLFMEFVRFVRHYSPRFFIMENVIGILSMKTKTGHLVKEIILREFAISGYNVEIFVLNAAEFGVPQSRIRVFFCGIRNDLPFDRNKLEPKGKYCVKEQVTIKEAISDLPPIESGQGETEQDYLMPPSNQYQEWARLNSKKVYNHIAMRHTNRLIERFALIKYGENVADVPREHQQRKRGNASQISGKIYSQNNMRPYPDLPSPTIAASFQSNFVHPFINRNFTAREGARLQSFPDDYIFKGKRTTMSWEKNLSQYQQIGNAVPPILSMSIAKTIVSYFQNLAHGHMLKSQVEKSKNTYIFQELPI